MMLFVMRPAVLPLLIASIVASLGCGSSTSPSSGSSGGGSNTQTFTATINNFAWIANGSIKATLTPAATNVHAASLNIVAQDSPLVQTLSVTVGPSLPATPLTTGTYQVGTTATTAIFTDVLGTTYQAGANTGSGSVTLTAFNTTTKVATGTFDFVLTQTNGVATRVVSNGTFSVNFQ
jgi:uncharacterized protein DUF6252